MSEMVATEDFGAPLHPDESEVPSNIRVSVETLRELGIDPRVFRPVVMSSKTGEVVDGLHRLEADPSWPTVLADLSPLLERIVRLVLNWNRRQYTPEEMREALGAIAEETGWTGNQIAENLAIPKSTVYDHLPSKYKREYPSRNHEDSEPGNSSNHSALMDAPAAVRPHHENHDVRIPDWLQQKFKELDKERAEKGEADRADEEPSETDTETISEDMVLTHEDPPEESPQSGTVEVILSKEEEEEPEPKTPEETLSEIYSELAVTPPTRFLQTALRHDHPDLSEEEIEEVIERTPRPAEPDRLTRIYGFACPTCGTWKPPSSMKRIIRELGKRDPELAALVKDRLERQGLRV